MQAPTGWYGKLPILGDFTRRHLPPAFIDPWDAWLQAGIAGSRAALGGAWLDNYLTAHVWHFVLMPGVLGPQAWAGVWDIPRLGREVERGMMELEAIICQPVRCSAVAGWRADQRVVKAKEPFAFRYNSDCRGTGPFLPQLGENKVGTVQIPVTLPTDRKSVV